MTSGPTLSSEAAPGVSLIVPVYNGAEMLRLLIEAAEPHLKATGEPFEILLVDDCSADDSWPMIEALARELPFVLGLRLSRNFGQQIAVSAGIAHAGRRYLIVMDCDLQNPPSAIPEIVARLKQGDDIVYTVSTARNNWRDEFTSQLFWFLLTKVLGVKIITNQLMLRGMSARFGRAYAAYPEVTRTVAGISRDIGLKHSVLKVQNQPRHSGRSSYNFFRRFDLMIHMIIAITTAPLSFLIYVSLAVLLGTLIYTIYYAYAALTQGALEGFTSIILSIFFFGSLTTLILGVIGMYLANIYTEVRRRPLFLVQERTDRKHG